MCINIPDARSNEFLPLNELQHFTVACRHHMRQSLQSTQSDLPILDAAQRQFPDDELMTENLIFRQKINKHLATMPKMLNPNRCINKNHWLIQPGPTPRDILKVRLTSTEQCQAASTFPLDQRRQRLSYQGALFLYFR